MFSTFFFMSLDGLLFFIFLHLKMSTCRNISKIMPQLKFLTAAVLISCCPIGAPPPLTLFLCNHFLFPTDHAPSQWRTGRGLLPDWLSTGWHFSLTPLARRSATSLSNSLFLTATSMRFSFRMQFCKRFAQESIRKGQGESTRMWKDPLPRS